MRFGSVCSGIEAASVAWNPLGWEPAFLSEIAPFPSAVLAHHYPVTPNLGDMTNFENWPDATIDLLCGGTPCQSFSQAGLRAGLDDPRGDLMLTFAAIARRYRPRWLVWENVPGVLSTNGGRDFGTFLGLLGHVGYGFAYRVLDAQYIGLAQRRKRVFVVGHLGNWRYPAAVLFERHSMSWSPSPRGIEGEEFAGTPAGGTRGRGGRITDDGPMVAHTLRGVGFDASEDGTGRGTPLIPVPFDLTQITSSANRSNPKPGDPCHTLAKGARPPVISFHGSQDPCVSGDVISSLGRNHGIEASMLTPTGVRRITPIEAERLQGFPDGYTAIKYRGKPAKDGPRYEAIGNSWAVNVARWIGARIQRLEGVLSAYGLDAPTEGSGM